MLIDAKDIVIRSSTDSGETFSPIRPIALSNESVLYTNPLGLLDQHTQNLWLAYVRCPIPPGAPPGRSVFQNCTQIVRTSLDIGASWSEEHDIPGSYPQGDGGVGSGLQLADGKLIFPRNGRGVLISETHGESWRLGKPLPHHGESQAVQLTNGSVIMQMRDSKHAYDYFWCRSDDGGETFEDPCAARSLPRVPDVPTSILRLGDALLFSHPNSAVTPCPLGRKNMSKHTNTPHHKLNPGDTSERLLAYSALSVSSDGNGDGGWSDMLQVWAGPSAYSSLAALPGAGLVGLLYEKSTDGIMPIDFKEIELAVIQM